MNKSPKKAFVYVLDLIIAAALVFLDQLTKNIVCDKLKGSDPFVLINGVFELHYLENRGAAFGMLQNATMFFLIAAIILFLVILYVIIKVPFKKKYWPWHMFAILLFAGGLGNMIDRISQNYVVDFLYFKLIDFPIFNVADIYVTVGTFLMIFFIIFLCKEEDLAFLSLKTKKSN